MTLRPVGKNLGRFKKVRCVGSAIDKLVVTAKKCEESAEKQDPSADMHWQSHERIILMPLGRNKKRNVCNDSPEKKNDSEYYGKLRD